MQLPYHTRCSVHSFSTLPTKGYWLSWHLGWQVILRINFWTACYVLGSWIPKGFFKQVSLKCCWFCLYPTCPTCVTVSERGLEAADQKDPSYDWNLLLTQQQVMSKTCSWSGGIKPSVLNLSPTRRKCARRDPDASYYDSQSPNRNHVTGGVSVYNGVWSCA